MTLGALTSHIVELHHWVYLAITKDSFDFHTDYQVPNATNVAELKKLLEESLLKSKAFVNTQTTAFWSTDWILKAGAQILDEVQTAAINNKNIFEVLMEATKVCSLGQITSALFEVGGQYRRNM